MSSNRVIIACAGSGKTTQLVAEALASQGRRSVIVTYTNNNAREIHNKFGKLNSGVPKHVDVMTWFSFLLRECARPYQRSKYTEKRIESLQFVKEQSALYSKETDTRRHYFANGEFIYSDKIAKFAVKCEAESGQSVTSRLRQIYTDVFIDEFQDLAGWDLDLIKMLLQSGIRVTLVGDPRQHIYSTNPSRKNKEYLGIGIMSLLEEWQRTELCSIEQESGTYRCNGSICEFCNALWPDMEAMTPLRTDRTHHAGVFLVAERAVEKYIQRFNPQVLRYDKRAKTFGCDALNFGAAKGRQFERVLIVPTGPIKKYLRSGDLSCVHNAKDKLHVAVTRAFYSVAFVYDGSSTVVPNRWAPSGF